jgi:hypothetical protein
MSNNMLNIYSDVTYDKKIRFGYQGVGLTATQATVYFENGYMFNSNDIGNYAHDFSDTSGALDNARNLVVNKKYVDNLTSGITYIESVEFTSSTLQGNYVLDYSNADKATFLANINESVTDATVDASHNTRVLLKHQTDLSENGIYTIVKDGFNNWSLSPDSTYGDGVTWNERHGIVNSAGILQPGIYIFDKHTSVAYITYCADVNDLTTATNVCVTEYSTSNSKLNPGLGLYKNYSLAEGFTFDVKPLQTTIRDITSTEGLNLTSVTDMSLNATAKVDVDASNIDLTATDILNVDAAIVDISGSTSVTINSSGDMSLISYSDLDLTATARVDVDAADIDLTATGTLNVDAAIVDISGSTSVTINSTGDMSLISLADLDLTATARVDVDAANIDLTATSTLNVDAAIVDISGSTSVTINSSGDMSLISYSSLDLTATATLDIDASVVDISGSSTVTINSSSDMSLISYSNLALTATVDLDITATNANITGITNLAGNTNITLGATEEFKINTSKFTVDENGNCDMSESTLRVLTITGATTFSDSDMRLKENINDIPLGLTFVNNLQPKLYNYNHTGDKNTHYGLIAQDVIGLLDNNNIDHTAGSLVGKNNDMYSLNYTEFVPLLINSIKELKSQVDSLKSEIDLLKN